MTLEKWLPVGVVLCVPEVHSLLVTKGQRPASPGVGSYLCLWTQFCRLPDCSFLASGGWSWVLTLWWVGQCQRACLEVAVGSGSPYAACRLMCGAVFLPCCLFGLRSPALGPTGCWVGPDHGTKMAASRGAHANK